jgi:hypothetical protein
MDIAIENNLKALSLFQKPVKLFITNQNPPTNLTSPNISSKSNQIAAAQIGPTVSDLEFLNTTATTYQNKSFVSAKSNHSTNK